jgi:hypothetical protein
MVVSAAAWQGAQKDLPPEDAEPPYGQKTVKFQLPNRANRDR